MLHPHPAPWPVDPASLTRVGILAGTFDPLTVAHTALGDAALADGCELVVYVVPETSVGKEDRGGHSARVEALSRRFATVPGRAVASSAAGLYVDIAEDAAATFPAAGVDLVCGADKVLQIMEQAYYDEPVDAVLDRLFAHARLLAAPRQDLSLPRHPGIVELALPAGLRYVSSTDVRCLRAAGEAVEHLLG